MLQVETFVEKSPYHTYITYSVFDETMTGHENHIFKLVSYSNVWRWVMYTFWLKLENLIFHPWYKSPKINKKNLYNEFIMSAMETAKEIR